MAMEAFESLPHRWRQVLWMTKVDELTPTEVAPLIGLSANSVAALAVRAREALRIAFVRAHLPHPTSHGCRVVLDLVARRAVASIAPNKELFVTKHLAGCESCRDATAGVETRHRRLVSVRGLGVGARRRRLGVSRRRMTAGPGFARLPS